MLLDRSTLIRAALAALALAVLGGCATPAADGNPESAVRSRANQRWQLLMAGKIDDAYRLLAPGYRAINTPEAYKNSLNPNMKWEAAQVVAVQCESAELCLAKIRLEALPMIPGGRQYGTITTHFDEKWIRADGQWWHFPNR